MSKYNLMSQLLQLTHWPIHFLIIYLSLTGTISNEDTDHTVIQVQSDESAATADTLAVGGFGPDSTDDDLSDDDDDRYYKKEKR